MRSEKKNVKKLFLFVLFQRPWTKKLFAKTRELIMKLKFVFMLVCFYLILITSKSLIRQRPTLVMPVIINNSEVSCHLYKDPKWDSINSVSFLALIIKLRSNLLFGVQTILFCSPSITFIWNDPPLFLKNQKFGNNLICPPFCLFAAQTRRPPFFDWALPWRAAQ